MLIRASKIWTSSGRANLVLGEKQFMHIKMYGESSFPNCLRMGSVPGEVIYADGH